MNVALVDIDCFIQRVITFDTEEVYNVLPSSRREVPMKSEVTDFQDEIAPVLPPKRNKPPSAVIPEAEDVYNVLPSSGSTKTQTASVSGTTSELPHKHSQFQTVPSLMYPQSNGQVQQPVQYENDHALLLSGTSHAIVSQHSTSTNLSLSVVSYSNENALAQEHASFKATSGSDSNEIFQSGFGHFDPKNDTYSNNEITDSDILYSNPDVPTDPKNLNGGEVVSSASDQSSDSPSQAQSNNRNVIEPFNHQLPVQELEYDVSEGEPVADLFSFDHPDFLDFSVEVNRDQKTIGVDINEFISETNCLHETGSLVLKSDNSATKLHHPYDDMPNSARTEPMYGDIDNNNEKGLGDVYKDIDDNKHSFDDFLGDASNDEDVRQIPGRICSPNPETPQQRSLGEHE